MRILEPDYYAQFQCAASDCPDTCCAAWEVILDEETKAFYDRLPGDFGISVRESMVFEDGAWMFRTKHGRCPLLTYDALCSVQLKCGEAHLCRTCREYPGFVSEYGLDRERGLSLSCPEAARMILERTEPVTFRRYETDEPLSGYHELDAQLYLSLKRARDIALSIAQNRAYPVRRRVALVVQFAEALQLCINEDRRDDMEAVCEQFSAQRPIRKHKSAPFAVRRTELLWVKFFSRLEILRPDWLPLLTDLEAALQKGGRQAFDPPELSAGIDGEQLLVYYISKFFLRSAYRGDVLVKAKLIAVSCLMIWLTNWLTHPKTVWENAYRYARELEHSEENLAVLEHWLEHAWRFSTVRILSLLN